MLSVDPLRGDPDRETVGVDPALPAALGELVVVVGADQGQVGEVGGAAVVPGDHMMPFAPLGCHIAAGEGAAGVAGDQREGLRGGGDPTGPPQVEDRTARVLEADRDVGLVGQQSRGPGRHRGAVGVGADAVLADEVAPGHRMINVVGVPPAEGRSSVRRAASSTAAKASWWRCPWVRSSAIACFAARRVARRPRSRTGWSAACVNGPRRAASFCPTSGVSRKSPAQDPSLRCLRWKNRRRRCSASSAGSTPSGVDRLDQFRGDPVEVLVAQLGGLLHQQHLPGFDGGGVAVLDLAEGGVDQGDLFGGDQPVALRGREVGAHGCQGFPGHAGAVGEVLGGTDPS